MYAPSFRLSALLFLLATAPCHGQQLEPAHAAVDGHHYRQALAPLQAAAQAGDRQARLSLGLMLLHGDSLYGPDVPRDTAAAAHWLRLAAGDGCQVSQHVLARLERPRPDTGVR